MLHAQQKEEACQQALNLEMETQMTEQILQYENEIAKLNDANRHLVSLILLYFYSFTDKDIMLQHSLN